ncbi:MAG: DUF1295 domain-containing protein [Comamonadaceae bacterium]|nr:DUF1295 domain-containing protein [Comamonadaceae bacterium]
MATSTDGGSSAYSGRIDHPLRRLPAVAVGPPDGGVPEPQPRPQGACIEEGLRRYSRHPNYFGEVTVWWGVYVASIGFAGPIGLHLLAPLAMTLMFLFVSIPMMEKKIRDSAPPTRTTRSAFPS